MKELLTDTILAWANSDEAFICDPYVSARVSREDAAKLRDWLTEWLNEREDATCEH
jgi:hypothetical protein